MQTNSKLQKYPKTFKVTYFHQDDDKRNLFLSLYALDTTVSNPDEERKFYENINHEANLLITQID